MSEAIVQERFLNSIRTAVEPIRPFLDDDTVVEILLNCDGRVWVDQVGKGMVCTDVVMSKASADRMIRLLASAVNAEVNEHNPSLASTLPLWHARVQAMIPPVVEAPAFAIRKPAKRIYTLDDYVADGIMTEHQAAVLRDSIVQRKNILVAGAAGTGKSTLVNALLDELSDTNERLYIVESDRELQCSAPNCVMILTHPNYPGSRALMDALRFRPDRIIFGETRDGATTLDLLKAWNTGHPGGLATIHANDAELALDRVCSLLEEVMPSANRHLVGEAIDVCVFIQRQPVAPWRHIGGIVAVNGVDVDGRWRFEHLD